jgi:putative IMPACT (imprinted ancient) family translation regulator
MSGQTRLLLDKSVVRRYFEGVAALVRGLALMEEEQQAILVVHLAHRNGGNLRNTCWR